MTLFASKSAEGFYDDTINDPAQIPDDAKEITAEQHAAYGNAQFAGKVLDWNVPGSDLPVIVDRPVVWPTAAQLSADIDTRVAEIYTRATRFDTEQKAREAAAVAYKDAGYKGEVSPWISGYAAAMGLGMKDATDKILKVAELQRASLEKLGVLRMRKYELNSLVDEACAMKFKEIFAAINEAGQVFE